MCTIELRRIVSEPGSSKSGFGVEAAEGLTSTMDQCVPLVKQSKFYAIQPPVQ